MPRRAVAGSAVDGACTAAPAFSAPLSSAFAAPAFAAKPSVTVAPCELVDDHDDPLVAEALGLAQRVHLRVRQLRGDESWLQPSAPQRW